mmetsp:Transcript_101214/g.201072  ORF Transcript_101214/g.201072 Transcript_101214/m.201072 type:complete len:198 (+) Transcript_101214:76-669(+)
MDMFAKRRPQTRSTFFCNYCNTLIGEDASVYMHHGCSFCSPSCRDLRFPLFQLKQQATRQWWGRTSSATTVSSATTSDMPLNGFRGQWWGRTSSATTISSATMSELTLASCIASKSDIAAGGLAFLARLGQKVVDLLPKQVLEHELTVNVLRASCSSAGVIWPHHALSKEASHSSLFDLLLDLDDSVYDVDPLLVEH